MNKKQVEVDSDKLDKLGKKYIDEITDKQLAHSICVVSRNVFTIENFNFYKFCSVVNVQVLALINKGVISEKRGVKVENEIALIITDMLNTLFGGKK